MPTYRSLTLSLISQFDVLTIPEYAPPPFIPPDPFTDSSHIPTLVDPSTGVVSVYIPTYPCSQFWLSYSVSPPWPPGLLYYFKLFINGECLLSWGCGVEDEYKGKTMFGFYASPGGRGIERRTLAFGPPLADGVPAPGLVDDVMEVRVYRSKGRKMVIPEVKEYRRAGMQNPAASGKKVASTIRGNGIEFVNAGFLHQKHPRRYYKYALLDPLDQPFSTFRYYYRTWEQLEALGIISRPPSIESSSICSSMTEEDSSSRQGSVELRDALRPMVDILKEEDTRPLDLVEGGACAHRLSTSNSNSATKAQASSRSTSSSSSTTTTKPPRRYRPPTPPPSTSGPRKVTFMPTATGLVPTNLDPNPLGLHPPSLGAVTITGPKPSSRSSSPPSRTTRPTLGPQSSRESFATLVHNRINSPNPEMFKLTDLSATIEKTSSSRLNQIPASSEKAKRERTYSGSIGVLRTVFGRDNLRDESRDGASGRSRSLDGSKASIVQPAHNNDSIASDPNSIEQVAILAQGSNGLATGGEVKKRRKRKVKMKMKEDSRDLNDNGSHDSSDMKNKNKGKAKQIETDIHKEEDSEHERGRKRSTSNSNKAESRKLNLWEQI